MSFVNLKKLSKKQPVYVKTENDNTYIYTYVGNTIAYYIDNSFDLKEPIEIESLDEYSNINSAIEKSKKDEDPFTFDFDTESEPTNISSTNFVKSISQFTKFYNTEDYRTELTGLHVRNGNIFASDATIMRLKKSQTFPSECNMIIDVNPIVEYLGINKNKIKSTGKSLFAVANKKSDTLHLSVVTKDGNDALKVTHEDLNFIVISIGKSNLNFEFVKGIKPTHNITVHRESFINQLNKLIKVPETNDDAVKNYVRLNCKDELEMTNYVYYKNGSNILNMPYKSKFSKSHGKNVEIILNAEKLLVSLKVITDDYITLNYEHCGHISRITSDNTKDLLLIAQTTYK